MKIFFIIFLFSSLVSAQCKDFGSNSSNLSIGKICKEREKMLISKSTNPMRFNVSVKDRKEYIIILQDLNTKKLFVRKGEAFDQRGERVDGDMYFSSFPENGKGFLLIFVEKNKELLSMISTLKSGPDSIEFIPLSDEVHFKFKESINVFSTGQVDSKYLKRIKGNP